jgi:tetratricopeptide (TPR) repeat protein
MYALSGISLLLLLINAGCAAPVAAPTRDPVNQPTLRLAVVAGPASTQPADPKASLPFDQIEPPVTLAAQTQPDANDLPAIESVRLFAEARIAELDGRRSQAAVLLEKALRLDPNSFELHRSLGDLYASASDARATDEWEKAAAIEPDHLDLQINLGRQFAETGDLPSGLQHLRLALLTSDYRHDDPAAGEADFFLARVLQQSGYDRAALQLFERLMSRLQNPRYAVRRNTQMAVLLQHPEALAQHIAELYEKSGAYDSAVKLLRIAVSRQPASFPMRSRLAHDYLAAGDKESAMHEAAEMVTEFHADRPSLALLRELAGNDAADVLEKLRQTRPQDRTLTYGLADVLTLSGQRGKARAILDAAAARWPDDLRVLGRQVRLQRDDGDLKGAARRVILALDAHSDLELELERIWDLLTEPSPAGTLRLADLQAIDVTGHAQAARSLLVSRMASAAHRDALAQDALNQATAIRPIFRPAFREAMSQIWIDSSQTAEQKQSAADKLASTAANAGDASFAAELRGQSLLAQAQYQQAAVQFGQAIKGGDRSAEAYLSFSSALREAGQDQPAESLLWKVISDRPLLSDGYLELYALCEKHEEHDKAASVLSLWLSADPNSIWPARLQARQAFVNRRFTEAEHILLDAWESHPADPQAIAGLSQFYIETGQVDRLLTTFSQKLAAEPWNSTLAIGLWEIQQKENHTAEALQTLDHLRAAAAKDPDLLYTISGLYTRMKQNDRSEQVLQQVIKLDPTFAGANNDLGYVWAEAGKNLEAAESLARKALQAEPDNPSFLDSVGWVLYKRGKFAAAEELLRRAAKLNDPVVLDHLGDALYRAGDPTKAAAQWKQAAQRIDELKDDDREDLRQLRSQLLAKQQQLEAGKVVEVAPVGLEK